MLFGYCSDGHVKSNVKTVLASVKIFVEYILPGNYNVYKVISPYNYKMKRKNPTDPWKRDERKIIFF